MLLYSIQVAMILVKEKKDTYSMWKLLTDFVRGCSLVVVYKKQLKPLEHTTILAYFAENKLPYQNAVIFMDGNFGR